MPHFTTMADNALRDVTSQAFRKHSLDQLRHELTIERMDKCQIIVKVWRVLYRIKAVDAKKFMRPVLKGPSRVEDPTANVAETLRFGQIGFATHKFLSQNFMFGNIDANADSFRIAVIG